MAGTFGASLIDQLRKAAKDKLKTDKEVDALTFEKVLSDEGIPIPFANSAGFAAQTKEDIEAQKRTIDQIEDPAALANMVPDSIVGQLLNPDSVIRSDTGKFFANYARSRGFGVSDDASELGGDFKQALGERAAQHAQTLGFKEAERKQQQGFDVENVGTPTAAGLNEQDLAIVKDRHSSQIAQKLMGPASLPGVADITQGPPEEVDDLENTRITPAMASSIMAERATADATAVAESISVDQMNSYIEVMEQSIGAEIGAFGRVDKNTPMPMARQLIASVGTLVNSKSVQGAINARQKKTLAARKAAATQKLKDKKAYLDYSLPLTEESAIYVDNIATQHDLIVKNADAQNKLVINKAQADRSLANQLEFLQAKEGFDAEATQINASLQYLSDVAKGERAIDSDFFNHLLTTKRQLELVQAKDQSGTSGGEDAFDKIVRNIVKARPSLAGPITKILAQAAQAGGDIEAINKSRTAIGTVIDKFDRQHNAATRVERVLLGGDKLLNENFTTNSQKISALRAEARAVEGGRSNADLGIIAEEIENLEKLMVQNTRDLSAKEKADKGARSEMLLEIERIEHLYDLPHGDGTLGESLVGTFNQWTAGTRLAGEKIAELIPFFGDSLAKAIGLTDAQKELMARAGNLELTLLQSGAGKTMTEQELEIMKRTRPVLGNPNYKAALAVWKEQVQDIRDFAAIENSGTEEEKQAIIDRMTGRARKFLDRTDGFGTTGPESSKASTITPYTSADAMERDYNQLIKNGMEHDAAMELVNIRGLKEGK